MRVAGIALVAVALAAGCGGGDDKGAVEATPKRETASSPEDSGTTSSTEDPIEREKAVVIEAHEAAMDARVASAGPSKPNPDLPALADTHVDPYLTEWTDELDRMLFTSQAVRYPNDSELEIVEVLDVTFGWETEEDGSGGAADAGPDDVGNVATLTACVVDDFSRVDVASGKVKAGGDVFTVHETSKLRKVDGEWKLAERHGNNSWPGRSGCAAE